MIDFKFNIIVECLKEFVFFLKNVILILIDNCLEEVEYLEFYYENGV